MEDDDPALGPSVDPAFELVEPDVVFTYVDTAGFAMEAEIPHPVVFVVLLASSQPLVDVVPEFISGAGLAVDELDPEHVPEGFKGWSNRPTPSEIR